MHEVQTIVRTQPQVCDEQRRSCGKQPNASCLKTGTYVDIGDLAHRFMERARPLAIRIDR